MAMGGYLVVGPTEGIYTKLDPVNRLTHNLESLFDQFRCRKRTLDRPVLDLTFRCLDELRDYHRALRAGGQSTVDLAALTPMVIEALKTAPSASEPGPQLHLS